MNYLKKLLKDGYISLFLAPFFLILTFLLLAYSKEESHLLLNAFHSLPADLFFKYCTHFGDGAFFAVFIVIFAFVRLRWSLYIASAALMTLVSVYVLKKQLFKGMPRPSAYIDLDLLHLVEGVKMHSTNSFPSGHTITAFAIFIILALLSKKGYIRSFFVLVAVLAGYSRVYLSQHFIVDIYFGALIGIVIAVFSCTLIDNWLGQKTWVDKTLLDLKK